MGKRKVPDGKVAAPLSQDALRGKGAELAQVVRDLAAQEEEWKEKSKEHREHKQYLTERALSLAEDIETKSELREAQLGLVGGGGN